MRRPAIAAAALLLSAAEGAAFWNWGRTPSEPSADAAALVWVPDASRTDFEALRRFLERRSRASLTIALAPEDIPEDARGPLSELAESGRVEFALRIPGDPILPLVHGYRDRDVIDRLALGRILYRRIFGRFPGGFVPGAGALSPEIAPLLSAQQFRWTSVGSLMFQSPWFGHGDMVILPSHLPSSTEPEAVSPPSGIGVVVLSELDGTLAPGTGLEELERLFDRTGTDAWTSVAATLESLRPYSVAPDVWSAWSGDLSQWTDYGPQKRAWELYGRAVSALSEYQNSGRARLAVLDRATQALYAAQSARFFRPQGLQSPAVEREFRDHLVKVYKIIGAAPPRALGVPLSSGGEWDPPDDAGTAAGLAGNVHSRLGRSRVFFSNPEESRAVLPRDLPELPPGVTAQHLWTPASLQVDWSQESVDFTFRLERLVDLSSAPYGFDAAMLELYIDLNRLAGRGSTALLPERRGFLQSEDAWEFALVLSGFHCGLYRSAPGQPPSLAEELTPRVDLEARTVRVSVPRSRMRGNPAAWGYLFLTLAVDEAGARKPIPSPLAGAEGHPVLGLLGGLDAQEELLSGGRAAYRRFRAVRAEAVEAP